MKLRLAAVVVALASLAGCANGGGRGTATVWVTRDRGAHVLLMRTVPAGLTAMQGLDRVADIKTRYAGRYVQTIDGLEGSLTARRDWFYFVNGYEADRGAAEYRLHAGDVEWWDFRSWRQSMREPVVVGAFPEPFLHGYDGKGRPSIVVYPAGYVDEARNVARLVDSGFVRSGSPLPADANLVMLDPKPRSPAPRLRAAFRGRDAPGAPVIFVLSGDSSWLVENPRAARFHYEVP